MFTKYFAYFIFTVSQLWSNVRKPSSPMPCTQTLLPHPIRKPSSATLYANPPHRHLIRKPSSATLYANPPPPPFTQTLLLHLIRKPSSAILYANPPPPPYTQTLLRHLISNHFVARLPIGLPTNLILILCEVSETFFVYIVWRICN